jgi:hypothetical protein
MFYRLAAAAFCCTMTAACVTKPTEMNDGISINRVVERVKCELGQAVSANPALLSWAGVITLTLEVDQSGSVMPGATVTGPFNAGTFAVDVSGGVNGKSIQTSLVAVYFPIYELVAFAKKCPRDPRNQLEDSLGLQEWVVRTLELRNEGGLFKDKDKAIGYTLEFDLELSAGIGPGFTFARVNGKDGLSASRKTANTLEVALADVGLTPPRRIIGPRVIKEEESKGTAYPSGVPAVTDGAETQPKPKERIIEPVTRPGRVLSRKDKDQLDSIIRQLQLKNLKLRL